MDWNPLRQIFPGLHRSMRYRPLGQSGLRVSVVGFGTCQLRMIPRQQAIATLKRGFELGVNFVHTAPDYEGAEDVVAQAVEESGREVLVFTQGYGARSHFEWLFEMACRRAKAQTLPVFGIACVEDRESLGENVWGPGGIVEFLLEKKREGRLRSIFAETHARPEYIRKLIESNVFDSILLAYNTLGFHALSYFPEPPATFEDIRRNKSEIFPLARQHGVSLLLMKSLGGGLMCDGKAFPARARFATPRHPLPAGDVLRHLLADPDVTAVVPGTASIDEAEENARAGFAGPAPGPARSAEIVADTLEMSHSLCSRCGHCDALCSRKLPVSWLFRDGYVQAIGAETFETLDRLQYFHLHPQQTLACSTCDDVSCRCPTGIDIPGGLARVHSTMADLQTRGLLAQTPGEIDHQAARGPWQVKVVLAEVPSRLTKGASALCRLWWENGGAREWIPADHWTNGNGLEVVIRFAESMQTVALRHRVEPRTRTHIAFEIAPPPDAGCHKLQVFLKSAGPDAPRDADEEAEICSFMVETTS